MELANTIARVEARLASGDTIVYADSEPSHVRQGRFRRILDAHPVFFQALTTDGDRFAVDLVHGAFFVNGERYFPDPAPTTPLRVIYFKHMVAGTGSGPIPWCEFFVVGWQTTQGNGSNFKVGLKVFPGEHRWEITGDI